MHTARSIKAIRRGFTLLEVMIVLVIIGVLSGIVAFNLVGAADQAKADSTKTSLKIISGAMDLYRTKYNSYPNTIDLLMQHNMITSRFDSWDRPIDIIVPANEFSYAVVSSGSDGLPETADDLYQYPPNEIDE